MALGLFFFVAIQYTGEHILANSFGEFDWVNHAVLTCFVYNLFLSTVMILYRSHAIFVVHKLHCFL